MAKLK